MNEPNAATSAPTHAGGIRREWIAALVLVAATSAAYLGTFRVPFHFDDIPAIKDNPSIRAGWPFIRAFSPPPDTTVTGRPIANVTFSLNHMWSGLAPWSYHVVNLVIHVLAGLALYGIVRRTLGTGRRPLASDGHRKSPPRKLAQRAERCAFAVSALWLLHPLQTESVTYVVQRVESLMGLFYLLTLYAFVRSALPVGQDSDPPSGRVKDPPYSPCWLGLSVIACALGMATKEVMVSAPLIILLYDRTFVAGSFTAALRARRCYYAALAGTWLLLAWLMAGTEARGGTAGLNTEVAPWHYALTQLQALVLYLKLSVWPGALVFDYGRAVVADPAAVVLHGLIVPGLLAATVWALWRRPVWGFAGAWFFAILAPTTSVVPIATQTIAEHRMYLPLAAIVAGVVVGLDGWIGARARVLWILAASALAGLTWQRNAVYRDSLRLWTDTAQKRPGNERAHYSIGAALNSAGRKTEAIAAYRRALHADPAYPEAHHNLGMILVDLGRLEEALAHFEAAARAEAKPEYLHVFGNALVQAGRPGDAVPPYEAALRQRPDYADAHASLGSALAQLGRVAEALPHFDAAFPAKSRDAQTITNHGSALLQLGRVEDAIRRFEEALRLNPDFAEAHANLGLALIQIGRLDDAARHYAAVLRLDPKDISARNNLGYIALQRGRPLEAVGHYEAIAQLTPSDPVAHYNLGVALVRAMRSHEATTALETALRLKPDYAEARHLLLQLRQAAR